MAKRRMLVCWMGHSDLRALAATLPAPLQQQIMTRVGGTLPQTGEQGPIRTLTDREDFEQIHLLSNYPADWTKQYVRWIGRGAQAIRVSLQDPTDYGAIFRIADVELGKIRARPDWKDVELCLHLSPGTPAMAAVWLLLGKTRYPATFFETFRGTVKVTQVPFDLTIDVLPELLRNPDLQLQHLAAHPPSEVAGFEHIAGDSRAIRLAVGRARRAAMRGVSVLLLGESGTGKEMFAQAIHQASPRRHGPFVALNCAAISKDLLESELFGHRKGAFTGADRDRPGAFEQADGGTLFLDEVGECDVAMQAKLLRVLQPPADAEPCCRIFRRVGDTEDRRGDVRILAATNRDLLQAVQGGQFREDLYYRLAVITIQLPALRERRQDMPKIVDRLLGQINRQFRAEEPSYEDKTISAAAISFVKQRAWPGNIRQLYNTLLQAVVMSAGDELQREDLAAALAELPPAARESEVKLDPPLPTGFDLQQHLDEIQRKYLRHAMKQARGVKAQAAKLLGMKNYQTLDAQLKRLEVGDTWTEP